MQHGVARRLPGQGPAGPPLRRPAPPRRLLGDGLQDRRLDGLQAGDGAGRPGAARADHAAHGQRPRGRGRRRRSATSTPAAAGRWAWSRRARRPRSRPRCRWPRCSTTRRDLRAITGGRGDYTMEFARHEEIPVAPRPEGDLRGPLRRRKCGPEGRRQRRRRVQGKSGPGGVAAVATDPSGEVLAERSETIGEATNNVAEYRALLLGIELAKELGADEVGVRRRLQADRRAGAGNWKVKQEHLRPLHTKVRDALRDLGEVVDPPRQARRQRARRRAPQRGPRRLSGPSPKARPHSSEGLPQAPRIAWTTLALKGS